MLTGQWFTMHTITIFENIEHARAMIISWFHCNAWNFLNILIGIIIPQILNSLYIKLIGDISLFALFWISTYKYFTYKFYLCMMKWTLFVFRYCSIFIVRYDANNSLTIEPFRFFLFITMEIISMITFIYLFIHIFYFPIWK